MSHEYEGLRRVVYRGDQTFIPACPTCGRFVKADAEIQVNIDGEPGPQPNATCKHCGRVNMYFEGFVPQGGSVPC